MLLPIPGKKGKEAAAGKPVARPSTRQKKAGRGRRHGAGKKKPRQQMPRLGAIWGLNNAPRVRHEHPRPSDYSLQFRSDK